MNLNDFPPISDYGFISDCHSCALVSRSGSIDWACFPRFDSGSCFARLLDWEKGGFCQIAPTGSFSATRRYLEDTLILETTFENEDGKVRLIDCFPMKRGGEHEPHQQILRIVEGVTGNMELELNFAPRFDYGAIKPWIRTYNDDQYIALGGNQGLLVSGNFCLTMKHRHHLTGSCRVGKGERSYLSMIFRSPETLDEKTVLGPKTAALNQRLEETVHWWRGWVGQSDYQGLFTDQLKRSAMVLKGLTNAPTGAIVAAATTSLPEAPGGSRNWDYRFTWVRDSCFSVRSLTELGYSKEAEGFRRFVERSAAGSAEELQILFGIGGERRLTERSIQELAGYRGAKPVRIGNGAETQKQLDVYGELLDLSWRWHKKGYSPDEDYWEFLTELVNAAASQWRDPDRGIWEMRGKPRHFVLSKAMCWTALDYGIRLADELGRDAPTDRWKQAQQELRHAVEEKGYDSGRGVFTQAFGNKAMDSSLLLLPEYGFIDFDDERMIRTTDAIRDDLTEDGLLRRYPVDNDDIGGKEGVFLPCSFWLVNCLARQGRQQEAHTVFQRAISCGNDLGLFSEEYDTDAKEMLGNFPQALTHLSLITAALALTEMQKK